jgi:serine/threonine protein kinase
MMIDWKDTLHKAKKMYEKGDLTQAQFTDILHNALKETGKENSIGEGETDVVATEITEVPQNTAANTTLYRGDSTTEILEPGTELSHYKILAMVGKGGMGIVYRARHKNQAFAEQTGEVAIKLMHSEYANDKDFRLRFIREAALGRKLIHPNIARMYDLVDEEGKLGLAMELVDGDELNKKIPEIAVDPITVINFLKPLASAVDYLHENKIVHRDLKPANIKLRSDGSPVLMDFGIAKDEEEPQEILTQTGMAMGTYVYMAPEQMDAKNIDGAADRYALGLLSYHLLSGAFPWEKSTSKMRIISMKFSGELRKLRTVKPDLGPVVCNIVMKMLSANPTERHPTASGFVEMLAEALSRNEKDNSATLAAEFLHAFKRSGSGDFTLSSESNTPRPTRNKNKNQEPKVSILSAEVKPPEIITQPMLTEQRKVGEVCFDEVRLVGGRFWMGTDDFGRDERPRHVVELTKSYWVTTTQITQQLYREVIGESPSLFGDDNHPVGNINWMEALVFCNALSVRFKLKPVYTFNVNDVDANWNANGYRLPTEAEWEFFAKAGTETLYAGSDDINQVGWYDNNRSETTSPVAQRLPNSWGIYDMTGNVWEWCWDLYDSKTYNKRSEQVILDPTGPDFGIKRIYRGCSCRTKERRARLSYRHKREPSFKGPYVGFRVIRTRK